MSLSKVNDPPDNYQVARFNDGSTDFVPKEWIYFDSVLGLVTKYMPPPYDVDNFNTLNELIRSRAPVKFPPVSLWPSYPISLIGQGATFEEVENKLRSYKPKELRRSFIYTEDSDYTPEEKAKKIEESFKREKLNPDDLLKVPAFESNSSYSSVNTSWEEDTYKQLLSQKAKSKAKNKKDIKKLSVTKSGKNKGKNKDYATDASSNSDKVQNSSNKRVVAEKTVHSENKEHDVKKKSTQYSNNTTSSVQLNKNNLDGNFNNNSAQQSSHFSNTATSSNKTGLNKTSQLVRNNNNNLTVSVERITKDLSQPFISVTLSDYEIDRNDSISPRVVSEGEAGSSIRSIINDKEQVFKKHSSQKATLTVKQTQKDKKAKREYKNCADKDIKLILQTLEKLLEQNAELSEIRKRLRRMEVMLDSLLSKNTENSKSGFLIENDINLPFKNIEEFKDFNAKLMKDNQFKLNFMTSLNSLNDANFVVTKTITNIFKKYFTKELALNFTNTKKSGDKEILKYYKFHACLIEAIIATHFDKKTKSCVADKDVSEAIGIVLANVKDWEGGRKERTKKPKE